MTGGEPLMDHNTYRVFDYVVNFPKPDLHLAVTSNFSVEPKIWLKYLDYVKRLCNTQIEHFMQYVSVDTGCANQAEYIRHGLDMTRLYEYTNQYLKEIPNRNSLTFIMTMNNLSITGTKEMLEYILNLREDHSHTYQRVWFDTPLLRTPTWQSIQILTPAYQHMLQGIIEFMRDNRMPDNSFVGFKDYEIQRMERNLAWMQQPQPQARLVKDRADFHRFFAEHDRRRSTNFLETFPEMREFWQECKYHAET
jgi:hypothetical protein